MLDRGKLLVIDNQVDQTTGTVKIKAEFPNADLQLWPGQFVNVRLLIDTLREVVVVPTAAVQRGPNGTFVYVVEGRQHRRDAAGHGHAAGRPRGGDRPRRAAPASRVVTTGFARLTDGTQVAVSARRRTATGGAVGRTRRPAPKGGNRTRGETAGQRRAGEGPALGRAAGHRCR